jgi:hypothetical protein
MLYVLLLFVLLAVAIFIEIQRYMSDPQRNRLRDEWFAQFQKFNLERQRDPAVAWRVTVIEQAFHRQNFA